MNRKLWKKLSIDTRTSADIEEKISELAQMYETGWHFDEEKPDIGSTLAKIFAGQMEENISRVNDILDRYHTEFVNILDISLLPAKPSSGVVTFDVLTDTIPGVGVPKGTKLIAGGTSEEVIFETDHSLYVTGSRIVSAFMTDGEEETFSPMLGDFTVPRIYGDGGIKKASEGEEEEETEEGMISEDEEEIAAAALSSDAFTCGEYINVPELEPFTLFGRRNGVGMDAVMFYHNFLFNVEDDEIYVRFEDAKSLVKDIASGKFRFKYVNSEGLNYVDEVRYIPEESTFVLKNDKATETVPAGGERTCMIALVAEGKVEAARKIKAVSFSARGISAKPESVSGDGTDLPVERFLPFTDILNVYSECFIGGDRYFAKAGAHIIIRFELTFEENRISIPGFEEDVSLKIIKRKPKHVEDEVYADSYVNEISIEYFNGVGYKRLVTDTDITRIFEDPTAKTVEIGFVCPDDWVGIANGAYDGRSIRIQITRSDNCYLRPTVHHYPVIKNMTMEYSYDNTYLLADHIEAISGTKRIDLSRRNIDKKDLTLFSVSEYKEDALYLGLSSKIEQGPASILFELEDGMRFSGINAVFEYSGPDGSFRQMKILDYTEEFSKTGVVGFVPPSDWVPQKIEGKRLYWLRIVRQKKEKYWEDNTVLPKIKTIIMNGVNVSNIETKDEADVYLDDVTPHMRFAIGTTGVLDANVWVNEMGRYSQDQMRQMKLDDPDNIRIEEDLTGVITAFYVLWKETDRLETSDDPRVYLLDRLSNELIFGDGITTWIPRVMNDIAIKFSVRCCDGAAGNVEAGSITDSMEHLLYIGEINNPNKSYGGSNIESLDNALERGASIISSRRRLITMDDYLRAISAYSDTIDQVAGIVGQTVEGVIDDSSLTFILLMKDFAEGSFAFHRVAGGLKSHLMQQCELTVSADELHLIEPIFVDISTDIWITVVNLDDSFEIQNMLRDCLGEYLNPIGYDEGKGWKIGTIPKKPQILMRLGILKSRAIVRKSVMIATYTDSKGHHEVDLEDLKVTPFMVCRSGRHEVHIIA